MGGGGWGVGVGGCMCMYGSVLGDSGGAGEGRGK